MNDKDGHIKRCKYSDLKFVNNYDNKDFVCTNERLRLEHLCYADEYCRFYQPDTKEQ